MLRQRFGWSRRRSEGGITMHTHLAIAETIGDEQGRELVRAVQEYGPALADTPGFFSLHIDVEDGGRMILVTTAWQTRKALLNYAASRLLLIRLFQQGA